MITLDGCRRHHGARGASWRHQGICLYPFNYLFINGFFALLNGYDELPERLALQSQDC
jgi:hypothetical protein